MKNKVINALTNYPEYVFVNTSWHAKSSLLILARNAILEPKSEPIK